MDKNNILTISLDMVSPKVRMANYRSVYVGQSWFQHSISDLELIMIIDGEFTAEDPENSITELRAGDILLIRANYPCDLICVGGTSPMFSCIHHDLISGLSWAKGEYVTEFELPWVVNAKNDFTMVELFRQCADEQKNFHPYKDEILSLVVKNIWLRMARHMKKLDRHDTKTRKLGLILSYIKDHFDSDISRSDLADRFGITPEHVNLLFKKELGLTPGQVIMRTRIDYACNLLMDGALSISEIAYKVGYNDPLYFSRVFRKMMGVSPSKFYR